MVLLQKYLNICLLIFIAALYALMSYWTPVGLDDWMFMGEWHNLTTDNSFSFSKLYNFWLTIREVDNGRLSNTLVPVFLIYSPFKEIFPIITGLFVALIIWLVSRLAFNKSGAPFFTLLVWTTVILLLPWRNNLFVADYSINYLWTAGITLVFMSIVMRRENLGWTFPWFITAMFLALSAGLWHEGFALSTIGGFLLYSLSTKRKFSVQWWLIGCFYALVALANYLCPGMLTRTRNELAALGPGFSWAAITIDFLPVLLLIILFVGLLLFPAGRRKITECSRNPWFFITPGIVITGSLLSILFVHQPRSAFWPDLMAIVMLFILTESLWVRIYKSFYKYFFLLLLLCIAGVTMGSALVEQYAYHREAKVILDKMSQSNSGSIYYDLKTPSKNTILALKMPSHSLWVTPYTYKALRNFNHKRFPAVVPAFLGDKNWRDFLTPLALNSEWNGAGDGFISQYELPDEPEVATLSVILNSGEEVEAAGMLLPYLSPDGTPLVYLKIYGIPSDKIKGFRILP